MAAYLTDEFFQCYNVYSISKDTGSLPFAGGWAQQPEWMIQAILLFKREAALWERREYDERKRGS